MIAVASLALLTGCGGSGSIEPVATTDDTFLDVVREEIPALEVVADDALLGVAHDTCDALEEISPLTRIELLAAVEGFSEGTNGEVTPEQSAYFIGASAGAFCPDIASEIKDIADGSSSF